jgi:diguanylate cyclase (GGDEF)-like protein
MGGDEFAVLAPAASDEPVERLDRRVREGIDRFNETTTEGYRLEASVGVARCEPGDRMSLDDMLGVADSAMYEEKRSKAKVVTS